MHKFTEKVRNEKTPHGLKSYFCPKISLSFHSIFHEYLKLKKNHLKCSFSRLEREISHVLCHSPSPGVCNSQGWIKPHQDFPCGQGHLPLLPGYALRGSRDLNPGTPVWDVGVPNVILTLLFQKPAPSRNIFKYTYSCIYKL